MISCFIPARFHSTRLPGKSLLKINNQTIINLTYHQVKKCQLIDEIIVLTDCLEVKEEVESFGGQCFIVEEDCLNGTERIVKYCLKNNLKPDIIVNVQGDEPFINPENIDKTIQNFLDKRTPLLKCSTLHYHFKNHEDVLKRSNGKLILDQNNNILYCSRNVIPGSKNQIINPDITYTGHIGVFVYDGDYLINQYLNENTKYQMAEDIEWLKILEQGYQINSCLVEHHEIGLDTPEDYDYLLSKYSK